MHVRHRGVPIDGSRAGHTAPQSGQGTVLRSSPGSLRLACAQPDGEHLRSGGDPVAEARELVVAGEFAVRWERRRATLIVWLSGSLDRATATLLDRELDARPTGTMRLIVDLTGLEFIDSPGLDALVRVHWRASRRGDQLSFRHGPHVAQRPLQLTRTIRQGSRCATPPATGSDQNSYVALALACADVDHPAPPGDRPGEARTGSPRWQQARAAHLPVRAPLAPRHLHLAVNPHEPHPPTLSQGSKSQA